MYTERNKEKGNKKNNAAKYGTKKIRKQTQKLFILSANQKTMQLQS